MRMSWVLFVVALAGIAATTAQSAPASFRDCATACPEMISLPGGSFMMGGLPTEENWSAQEAPQHRVLVRAFAMAKNDVTFDEWSACVADGGCDAYVPGDYGFGRGNRPVLTVNWNDAQTYVTWLSRKTGKHYRLPTEAEWEYAARGGTTTAYYWGDAVGEGHAVCNGCGSPWDKDMTAPVGSFAANPFGLFDMAGNVMQWTADCWHPTYGSAPTDGSAWMDGDCTQHVVRGGNWFIRPFGLRSAFRRNIQANERDDIFGFRVVREARE